MNLIVITMEFLITKKKINASRGALEMEIDIEICLSSVPKDKVSNLAKQFNVSSLKEDAVSYQDVVIRQEPGNRTGIIDHVVRDFLTNLYSYSEIIKNHQGVLRLGIFYNLDESVVFPFRLSSEVVKSMAELNLAIDSTSYPCSPDDE